MVQAVSLTIWPPQTLPDAFASTTAVGWAGLAAGAAAAGAVVAAGAAAGAAGFAASAGLAASAGFASAGLAGSAGFAGAEGTGVVEQALASAADATPANIRSTRR